MAKTNKKSKARIVYTPQQFMEMGFDGEIGKYMREHKNTAIVGEINGVDRHVIEFTDREAWINYKNPYSQ